MPDSTAISWLVGCRLESFTKREYDWIASFGRDTHLVIACLWRLIEGSRIRFTSQDEGQWFGLPAPVTAAEEIARRLSGKLVEAAALKDGTLDVELRFDTGHLLQIIPDSSGYEAWDLSNGRSQFIAVGGGDLAIFDIG